MFKKLVQKIVLYVIKIDLNLEELNELSYWQRNSYLSPFPIFVKKEALNSINTVNSHWFEVCNEKSMYTDYLSKIGENVYFLSNAKNFDVIKENSNRKNIENIETIENIEDKISELLKKEKDIFILVHTNSSPKIKRYSYHKSLSSHVDAQRESTIAFEERFDTFINKILKFRNITLVVDDFDILDISKKKHFLNNKEFDVISNYLIIKT